MLSAVSLRPRVRIKILEYIEQKSAGHYGGSKRAAAEIQRSHELRPRTKSSKAHDQGQRSSPALTDNGQKHHVREISLAFDMINLTYD